MIVGLTGNIGAGKSAAAAYLTSLGAAVFDADAIARELRKEHRESIALLFPECAKDGALDIGLLAKAVFSDPKKRERLEAFLHPLIFERFSALTKDLPQERIIILEAALLFESGFDKKVDQTLLITAREELLLERAAKRDNATLEQVKKRMAAQWPQAKKVPLADAVIDNSGTLEEFHRTLAAWYKGVNEGI